MRNVDFGGSVMAEFEKIAREKGWVVEDKLSPTEQVLSNVWNSLSKSEKDSMIGGWEKVSSKEIVQLVKQNSELSSRLMGVNKKTAVDRNTMLELMPNLGGFREYLKTPQGKLSAGLLRDELQNAQSQEDSQDILLSYYNKWNKDVLSGGQAFPAERLTKSPVLPEEPPEPAPLPPPPAEQPEFKPVVPEWAQAEDGKFAKTIRELVSLANDLDEMGSIHESLDVDNHLRLYKNAVHKLYDITGGTGEKLIEQAHPGGGPTIAPSKEEGGKVETIVEEQKKSIDKATKNPTGKYAELVSRLVATANKLDAAGDVHAARVIDKTIDEIREALASPYVGRSSATEAADSKDNKASIDKMAGTKELAKFIPEWDRIVKKFDSFADKIIEYSATLDFLYPSIGKTKSAYRSARKQIYSLSNKWRRGWIDKNSLSAGVLSIADTLDIGDDAHSALGYMMKFFVFGGSAAAKMQNLHDSVISNLRIFAQSVSRDDTSSVKPLPTTKQVVMSNVEKYQNTLKKLIRAIENPLNKGVLDKSLSPLGGANALKLKLQSVLKSTSGPKFSGEGGDRIALQNNRMLWTRIVKPLVKRKAISMSMMKSDDASYADDIGKKAYDLGDIRKSPSKKKTYRSVSKKDPLVGNVQNALKNAGFPLAVDNAWGPKSAKAYNLLMAKLKDYYPKLNLPAVTANKPDPKLLNFGLMAANALKKLQTRFFTDEVEIAPGVKIGGMDLANPRRFVSALAVSAGGVSYKKPGDELHPKNAKVALSYLSGFIKRLRSRPDFYDLQMQQKGVASKLLVLARSLAAQFSKSVAKSPSKTTYDSSGLMDPFTKKRTQPKQKKDLMNPFKKPPMFNTGRRGKWTPERIGAALRRLPGRSKLGSATVFSGLAMGLAAMKEYKWLLPRGVRSADSATNEQQGQIVKKYLLVLMKKADFYSALVHKNKGQIVGKHGESILDNWTSYIENYQEDLRELLKDINEMYGE